MTIIVGSNYMYTQILNSTDVVLGGNGVREVKICSRSSHLSTQSPDSGLKLTLLISLVLKECVCFVLFVTLYFTGYGPYPGRYTLLFTLNTVPCRLIA